jgi:hypothetical protein
VTNYEGTPPLVVGVEHTEGGRRAIVWAADEAARRRMPLLLVHALDWQVGIASDAEVNPHRGTRSGRLRNAGLPALDEARKLVVDRHPGLSVDTKLVDGQQPAPEPACEHSYLHDALLGRLPQQLHRRTSRCGGVCACHRLVSCADRSAPSTRRTVAAVARPVRAVLARPGPTSVSGGARCA